ncbi:MAG: hypothetical protein JST79_05830 [Acidobacteria bacterium]|nr:hypothetical protein [Acidobacteriota bacterium]
MARTLLSAQKKLRVLQLGAIVGIVLLASGRSSACSSLSFEWGNARAMAALHEKFSTAIFEGTPQAVTLHWDFMDAKEGDLLSDDNMLPYILITFKVEKTYKGELGPEVQIRTGLGGGDCGSQFSSGITYLVFAYGPNMRQLTVSRSSSSEWIGDSRVQAYLRFLRKQRPTAKDLVEPKRWDDKGWKKQEEERHRDWEESEKRFAAVTGQICGKVTAKNIWPRSNGTISFLSTMGYSPVQHPTATVQADGSFCSGHLGPGQYYLYFRSQTDDQVTSALYYPGVSGKAQAVPIQVMAGQTTSNVYFNTPAQETFSIFGSISVQSGMQFDPSICSVVLASIDGSPNPRLFPWETQIEKPSFFFPIYHFRFEHVIPGRYIPYITCRTMRRSGWFTKKTEVDVTTRMKFISLALVQKK